MNMPRRTKLYAYVDESGQDTEGRFFVVTVVVVGTERDTLLEQLEALELRSRKGRVKWRRARYGYRQAYIDELVNFDMLSCSIFVTTFNNTQAYLDRTVEATANAIHAKTQDNDRVTVFVDGLTRAERETFTRRLRARRIERKKVRGVRDEQSNAGIRLADALCGLVRDVEEGQPWAVNAFARLQRRGLVVLV